MPVGVSFSKSTVFEICRQNVCRFRVNRRPIRHIFHRFQNVPASSESRKSVARFPAVAHFNLLNFSREFVEHPGYSKTAKLWGGGGYPMQNLIVLSEDF